MKKPQTTEVTCQKCAHKGQSIGCLMFACAACGLIQKVAQTKR